MSLWAVSHGLVGFVQSAMSWSAIGQSTMGWSAIWHWNSDRWGKYVCANKPTLGHMVCANKTTLGHADSQKRQILLSWICSNAVSEHKETWEHYLPLVEYAYNNTVHTSTCKAPFEIVAGGKKVPPILQTKDKIFEADKYVQNTDEADRKIKLALEKTQSKQKKPSDRHRHVLVFSLGDWVLLRFEKARLRKMKGKECLFPKLGMRYYGLFQVCDKISDVAYRLKLLEGWKIHIAFHVSLLRPFVGDVLEDMVPEEQPEVEELDEILVP
ncbi:hypothetical protein L7F22_031088 [Adiantum nelumboides]|nr:hypothetical protein [Adiantum nelumboides]